MQFRCYNCHKPFSLSRDAIYFALDKIAAENLTHYDVPCPHCRRVNRVSPKELRRAAPNWEEPTGEKE
ncbi:hypothetical protein ACFLV7_10600 [Chloroflexota bacterium]